MNALFYTPLPSPALTYAQRFLQDNGVAFTSLPGEDVTHLLLPVPLKQEPELPAQLSQAIAVGGNLSFLDREAWDLLKDPGYVAQNASITAHCAIKVALRNMERTFQDCSVLVIGWGRIGKCLARLLKGLQANVTVAARKESDRAMLQALGYAAVSTDYLDGDPYQVIFNTVPVMLLPQGAPGLCIELASRPGIGGSRVVSALGLPGKEAPESSGALIGKTVLQLLKEDVS